MTSLLPTIKDALSKFCESHKGQETASDILRAIHEEAYLMKETQDIKDSLDSDPFERFNDDKSVQVQIQRFKSLLRVTSCRRVRTGPFPDYCTINAVVAFTNPSHKKNVAGGPSDGPNLPTTDKRMELTFRYERKTRQDLRDGCHVWYSIEVSVDYGPKETLLLVQVWAPSDVPSVKPAVCINPNYEDADDDENENDEEGGWEDMDEDDDDQNNENGQNGMVLAGGGGCRAAVLITAEEDEHAHAEDAMETNSCDHSPKAAKKQRLSRGGSSNGRSDRIPADDDDGYEDDIIIQHRPAAGDSSNNKNDDADDDDDEEDKMSSEGGGSDSYTAYLDPDLLHDFLNWTNLRLTEGTAFFLLMTFPFYEHEWDLVGYVLDEVFGSESDDDEEE